jgi:hypothetical protein
MTLRSRLYLLVAVALLPMALFAAVGTLLLLKHEREVMERDAIGRTRSAMSAVDAHLRGTIHALQTLGASKNLESGNIAAFHAETQRVLKGDPAWVNISLLAPDGMVLINAVYAYGKPEPKPPNNDSLELTANGTRIAVSGVRPGNVVRNPTVRVNLPVRLAGKTGYVLVAPMNMKQIAEVLLAQQLPETWTIALVDRDMAIVAAFPPVPTGVPASDEVRKAIEPAPQGWSRSDSEAAPYIAHVTSDLTGWVLAVGIPPAYVEAGARRSFTILAVGIFVALAVGLLLAGWIASRISSTVRQSAAVAT